MQGDNAMAKESKGVCLVCKNEPKHARGLGETCYRKALRSVNDGETTWGELVELGLAEEPYQRDTQFSLALERARMKKRRPLAKK
jgi:hypothetical protein